MRKTKENVGGKMAVRKLRKKMKPVIWVITIAMFLSMIMAGVVSLKSTMSQDTSAFKLNGDKVSSLEVDRSINGTVNQYSQYLGPGVDRELISTIAFSSVVDKKLTLDIAKKLKVKVARKDVNAEFDKVKDSVQDRAQFSRMLQAQGYNESTLKADIKESLTIQKVMEQVREDAKPTEAEVKEFYDDNQYGTYYGKDYEEVKSEIEKSLQDQNGMEEYAKLLANEKKDMKLTDLDSRYAAYEEKTEVELDGFKFTNVDMAQRVLRNLFATQGNKEAADQMAMQAVEQEVKLAKAAMEMGITVDETLPVDQQLFDLRLELSEKIREDYNIDEAELTTYFEEKKLAYDVLPSADANIALFSVVPSEEDTKAAKTKAEEVLAEVTPENFSDMAIKYSEGPSGPQGGDLGFFGKGQMVPEFEEAAFNTEAGTIYPEAVKTQFGYHLIYVEEVNDDKVKARHILFTGKASDETKANVVAEAKDAAERINSGDIKFEDLTKGTNITFAKNFENVSEGGYIPGVGYKEKLGAGIFAGDLDKAYFIEADGEIYVYEKTKVIEYKEASLDEMREKVEYDFLNEKVQEKLGAILEVDTAK